METDLRLRRMNTSAAAATGHRLEVVRGLRRRLMVVDTRVARAVTLTVVVVVLAVAVDHLDTIDGMWILTW